MKVCGVDYGIKHISFKYNGIVYIVSFRCNLFKGIYDVRVYGDPDDGSNMYGEMKVEDVRAYPGLLEVAKDVLRNIGKG